MKKHFLFSLMLLLTISFVSAQSSETNNGTSNTDTDPLASHYGKQLVVSVHKKNNVVVNSKVSETHVFGKDGKYIYMIGTKETAGTWTYNVARKRLTLILNNVSTVWDVESSTATTLNLKKTDEILSLKH